MENVERDHAGVGTAVLVAAGALVLTVVVRAAYVAPLLARGLGMQERLQGMQDKMGTTEGRRESFTEMNTRRGRRASERDLDRFALRVTRVLADALHRRRYGEIRALYCVTLVACSAATLALSALVLLVLATGTVGGLRILTVDPGCGGPAGGPLRAQGVVGGAERAGAPEPGNSAGWDRVPWAYTQREDGTGDHRRGA